MSRLDEIEKWNNELKLRSDDHGHSCDDLRKYCERELIYSNEDVLPFLLDLCRRQQAALDLAIEALILVDKMDCNYCSQDIKETLAKVSEILNDR